MVGKIKAVNNFGIDAEIAQRRNANYPQKEEDEAVKWIEKVLGITFTTDFAETLQDGVILCELMVALCPGKLKSDGIYRGTMPFKKRENISKFIRVCRELGTPEADLFTTEALFEQKDPASVVMGLFALSRTLQTNKSLKFKGPILGPAVGAKGKVTAFKKVDPNSTTSVMNKGSSAVMQKTTYTDAREQIVRGENNVPINPNSTGNKMNQGSKGVMDQSALSYTNSRDQYLR